MDNIRELLEVTSDPGSENRLTVGDVKAWLAEYIEMRADEVANFPTEATAIHWDLVAANYHASKDAHFVVAYFSSDYATLMGGRGSIPLARAFTQYDFPSNPDEILDALAERFTTGDRWTTSASEVITWAQG